MTSSRLSNTCHRKSPAGRTSHSTQATRMRPLSDAVPVQLQRHRQTCTTRAATSSSDSNRRMSSGSEVMIATSPWRAIPAAVITTDASMTSAVPARPHNNPAARATTPLRGTSSQCAKARDNNAWRRPSRHACAMTPADTCTIEASSAATRSIAHTARSLRSSAISAPASSTSAVTPQLAPAPRRVQRHRTRRALSPTRQLPLEDRVPRAVAELHRPTTKTRSVHRHRPHRELRRRVRFRARR